MRFTLRQLQIFCAVAESGSTTAAAAAESLSQSAASAALNELESLIGARLFDRVGKRLVLNEKGRSLLPSARGLLDSARSIERSFDEHDGDPSVAPVHLRVAASTTIGNYLLPALLSRFRSVYPSSRLEVFIGNTSEVANAVAEFRADIGLIEGPCHVPDIEVIPWMDDEMVIVASSEHELSKMTQLASKKPIDIDQLRRASWLLREAGSGTREAVEQALIPHLHHLIADMTLGSSEAIKNAVAQGLGISCLSLCVVDDLIASKKLVALHTVLPKLNRKFALIHHSKKALSGPLNTLIALAANGLPA